MATAAKDPLVGGFQPTFSWRLIGSAAPAWPGFDVDILARVPDAEREDAVWHRERAKAILKAHSEVNELFGRDPSTSIWCLLAAGAQVGLAVACGHLPWWAMLLAAWAVGSSINIMLFQLGHECVHGLVFRRPAWNRWLFTLTTLPMFLSAHHTWWLEHLVHHNDMVLGISHFHGARCYQPTASHYGWLGNLLTFNAGLHVEHHDLMRIPWRRLPRLRRLAPEFYNNLEPIRSYTWLGLQFVFAGPEYFEARFNHEAHRNAARFDAPHQGATA
jgi:fatty acid desaturase